MIAGAWVCLLAPLAGAIAITLAGQRISRRTAGWISTLTTFVAFGGALVAFLGLWARDPGEREELSTAYTWLAAGDFEVGFEIFVDPLATVMMLVVSGVGGLIVWYSMGYMAGDDEERRYFAYMSLFVFSMLLLVEAGNLLLLLVGWGLVGLASYLLIGFWHHRPEAVAAAKKAFVMNAIGDATFALALVLLVWDLGTLEIPGFEFPPPPAGITVKGYDTDTTAFQALESGQVDAVMSATPTIQSAIDKGRPMQLLGDPLFSEPLSVAFDKSSELDNTSLVEAVSGIVEDMHADGTLSELSMEWYGEDITVDPSAQ